MSQDGPRLTEALRDSVKCYVFRRGPVPAVDRKNEIGHDKQLMREVRARIAGA